MWLRLIGALLAALSGFFRSLWRALRQLFHEAAGALFVVFAVIGGAGLWREWQGGAADWVLAVILGFTVMMAWFAFASFRSARRVGTERRN